MALSCLKISNLIFFSTLDSALQSEPEKVSDRTTADTGVLIFTGIVSHDIPNLVHRQCDDGSVGCPQWKAIKATAVYGTSHFSLWALRRIFISVS